VVVTLDGSTMAVPADFYDQFFAAVRDVMPDYGGRNLDALVDDLRELSDPLEVVWGAADQARLRLGEWMDRCIAALTNDGTSSMVTVRLA